MTAATALDRAHARMLAAGETEAARRGFFAALAAAELCVLLEEEPAAGSDRVRPLTVDSEAGPVVLAFDTADRLAGFVAGPAAMAALPGRELAALLAGRGLGLGLNLSAAPSAMLLPAEAMSWLAEAVAVAAEVPAASVAGISAPRGLPGGFTAALAEALPRLPARPQRALLVHAARTDGAGGPLLALVGVPETARAGCGTALAEALGLAGYAAQALDLVFLDAGAALAGRMAPHALVLDLPGPAPAIPGADPDRPPNLR
ncbi:SseB family protein [Rhodobacteraceae bacterium 2CG4]|uniref:SseB family protein n=1 Tax=Halovulum marinum TaxID=2662447 RepID=A0A6L5YYA6_9RHOB|nr:SseB family protein [Halovulum marinum]MSU89188.1 SseB family protein [Halovulum marinum]